MGHGGTQAAGNGLERLGLWQDDMKRGVLLHLPQKGKQIANTMIPGNMRIDVRCNQRRRCFREERGSTSTVFGVGDGSTENTTMVANRILEKNGESYPRRDE
ncbi:hypothetical protein Nepgr_025511 [Nepenthes gracilis]|uniref:Uncharacterized protein n=1 Tax=Nepenthes gracilis TaxID=150966 RepID=A0AAD3XZS0_NEPGR|nr:hypothetical protein Nepgr_025511 [Nepenthes gracilis]